MTRLLLLLAFPAAALASEPHDFVTAAPACTAARCVPLVLHVVVGPEGPVVTPEWLAAQLENANRLFTPLEAGFTLTEADALPTTSSIITTRRDRDRLGRAKWQAGRVDVYLVERLDDVDTAGDFLNGVHWRDRADRRRTWIVLASNAWPLTLAHELGHRFGLPHAEAPESLMYSSRGKKDAAPGAPMAERAFLEGELPRLRRGLATFFALRK